MEDEEALKQVPPHRFLQGIAKWKRAIIMIAGVTLNFVLGFLLLFVLLPLLHCLGKLYLYLPNLKR